MSTAPTVSVPAARALPPVLGRLLSGTFWLALRVPIQVVTSLWTTRLILDVIGPDQSGAYRFAWGFGFFQMLFEFGVSSALQRQISDSWTRGDKDGVDRAIACGLNFYSAMALVQVVALLGVAYWGLPHTDFQGESYNLIVRLLWLQIATAPCYGFSVVVSSVLQAARRYDFIPRFELAITIFQFLILVVGLKSGFNFFGVIVARTLVQIGLSLGPAVWVMVRELGHPPRFRGARWADYKALGHISFYMALIQVSVVLADKVDTAILGFVIKNDPGTANAIYDVVSKPFLQLRQTGWMLAYMVMPAVASLAAARDARGMERIKYDGTRLHVASLLPIGLLGWIYATPFLTLWIGDRLGPGAAAADVAPLMRLFLTASIPLVLSVPVQMAIGINKIEVIALAALGGALVNLPVSYGLTVYRGISGVIWGTVATTFLSNLLVPGIYIFRTLKIDPRVFLRRTLGPPLAGAAALVAASWAMGLILPMSYPGATLATRALPLLIHLTIATTAYLVGYLLAPAGREDLRQLLAKFRRKSEAD